MMVISDKIFYPGKVLYNTFNINFDLPFADQLEELNEDLIQVEYECNYLLDIGWFPEGNENGAVIIQVIHENQWATPVFRSEAADADSLISNIKTIVARINDGKNDGK